MAHNYDIKLIISMENDPRILPLILESARCVCMTRRGIDCEYDFSVTEKLATDLSAIMIGNTAAELARKVLRDIDRTIRRKGYEH